MDTCCDQHHTASLSQPLTPNMRLLLSSHESHGAWSLSCWTLRKFTLASSDKRSEMSALLFYQTSSGFPLPQLVGLLVGLLGGLILAFFFKDFSYF